MCCTLKHLHHYCSDRVELNTLKRLKLITVQPPQSGCENCEMELTSDQIIKRHHSFFVIRGLAPFHKHNSERKFSIKLSKRHERLQATHVTDTDLIIMDVWESKIDFLKQSMVAFTLCVSPKRTSFHREGLCITFILVAFENSIFNTRYMCNMSVCSSDASVEIWFSSF